jgi:hypothetical protein
MLGEYHRLKKISQAEWPGKKDISKNELFYLMEFVQFNLTCFDRIL